MCHSQWHRCQGQRRASLMECEAFAWNWCWWCRREKKITHSHRRMSRYAIPGKFHFYFWHSCRIVAWFCLVSSNSKSNIHFALHIYCTNIKKCETYLMRFDSLKRSRAPITPSQHLAKHITHTRDERIAGAKISPISIIIFPFHVSVFTVGIVFPSICDCFAGRVCRSSN